MKLDIIEQQGFDLIELTEETSQTIVWKAVQRTLQRTVVLRILKPGATPAEVEHFLSIARILARIKSESIASIFDIVSNDTLHYVVMEHVDGPTLEELVEAGGPLPTERILRLVPSLVVGIDQMWTAARIVHRNLKSATIRVATHGVAKITDFSLAIQAGPGVNATEQDGGHIVGTPCFLSPEQAQGAHTLTTQSDMYALGVVLYHLATGTIPFEQQDAVSVLVAQVKQQIPPPHHLNPSVSPAFSRFVQKLMMKAPEDRYPDWQAVLQDIRLLISGLEPQHVDAENSTPSTIEPFDSNESPAPPARKKKIRPSGRFAAVPATSALEEHAREIRRQTLFVETASWLSLAFWLLTLFWFRAVYQDHGEPEHDTPQEEELADAEGLLADLLGTEHVPADEPAAADAAAEPASPAHEPPAAADPAPAASSEPPATEETAAPPALPTGIPEGLASRLAKAFADGSLQTARQLVQANDSRFQEEDQLDELLASVPEPDTLIANYLQRQVGKPLIFERNGRQRTVIPREIADGTVRLESNGRGIDIPLRTLSADEKLRWMDRPQNAPQSVAYCLVLMHSSRRSEVPAYAAACPLLAPALIEAARVTSQ